MSVKATAHKSRNLQLGQSPEKAPEPSRKLKDLAASVYSHNKAKNAETSAYNKERKELYTGMISEKVTAFDMYAMADSGKIVLEVKIETPESEAMDVFKLYELLACEKPRTEAGKRALESFLSTVSATKKSVEENHGKNVATRIAYPKLGDENVNVGPKKV